MIPADGILEASDLFGRLDVGSHVLVAKQTSNNVLSKIKCHLSVARKTRWQGSHVLVARQTSGSNTLVVM